MAGETPQILHLYSDYVELTLSNGVKKIITLADFKHALDKSLNIQTQLTNSYLPPNCYMLGRGLDSIVISCYYTGETREVEFNLERHSRPKKFKIPFPNIVITHRLNKANNKWNVTKTSFFATDRNIGQLPTTPIDVIDRRNGIWSLPLPNMYGDGRMCYGQNSMPSGFVDDNFKALDWYFKVLFSTPFNGDLHIPEVRSTPENWMEELSKCKVFPYYRLNEYRPAEGVPVSAAPTATAATAGPTITVAVTPTPTIVIPTVAGQAVTPGQRTVAEILAGPTVVAAR